jgi:hypothetical protein
MDRDGLTAISLSKEQFSFEEDVHERLPGSGIQVMLASKHQSAIR